MWYYALFYLVGLAAGILSPVDSTKESLAVLEPITLTALFASLLVAFAGFDAKTERWQKFALQYGLIPLFGVYTVVLWEKSSVVGMVLLICVSGVHAGYWMSSIHSRNYRLEQFRLGFATEMPHMTRLIARLNGLGFSHQADAIVRGVLAQRDWYVDPKDIEALFPDSRRLVTEAAKEHMVSLEVYCTPTAKAPKDVDTNRLAKGDCVPRNMR